MSANSAIEWCDHTFNPWWGCARVSDGCLHCYAEALAKRYGHDVWGKDGPRRFFGDKHWIEPLRWAAKADAEGVRRRVFCASMADVFEDHPALPEQRARLWELIGNTESALDWLLLTKRPENVASMVPEHWVGAYGEFPRNAWIGTTVEHQRSADERIPHLLRLRAPVRFLSCEPLLGALDLGPYLFGDCDCLVPGFEGAGQHAPDCAVFSPRRAGLGWVIAGGESGHGARPANPEWFRSLRDQCESADVPFLFKQWGEYAPNVEIGPAVDLSELRVGARQVLIDGTDGWRYLLDRVGKKAAGRALDGREHNAVPTVAVAAL